MTPVDTEGDVRVGPGAEHRQGAGVRVHDEHFVRGKLKSPGRYVSDMSGEEREPRSPEYDARLHAGKHTTRNEVCMKPDGSIPSSLGPRWRVEEPDGAGETLRHLPP